jgi:hypothetical protein
MLTLIVQKNFPLIYLDLFKLSYIQDSDNTSRI